jgi:hypothetical protein
MKPMIGRPTMNMIPDFMLTCVPDNCRFLQCDRIEYLAMLTPSWVFWCPAALCAFLLRGVVFHARLQSRFAYYGPILRGLLFFVEHVLAPASLEWNAQRRETDRNSNVRPPASAGGMDDGADRLTDLVRVIGVLQTCTQSLSLSLSCCAAVEDLPSIASRSSVGQQLVDIHRGITRVQTKLFGSNESQEFQLHPFFKQYFINVATKKRIGQPAGLVAESYANR